MAFLANTRHGRRSRCGNLVEKNTGKTALSELPAELTNWRPNAIKTCDCKPDTKDAAVSMRARIVITHDDEVLIASMADALARAGHTVSPFLDPFAAFVALDQNSPTDILVTCGQFGPNKPHGFALARMARLALPDVSVIFTAPPEFAQYATGLGMFLPLPLSAEELVAAVARSRKLTG